MAYIRSRFLFCPVFSKKICLCLLLVLLVFLPIFNMKALCSEPSQKQDIIEFDHIFVNKVAKEIKIHVKLAIREGILEYFLVSDQGKTYESVFKLAKDLPSKLNFAMLLLGFKPLSFDELIKLAQKETGRSELLKDHEASLVKLEARQNGKKIEWQSLMKNRENVNLQPVWVYTGGLFTQGKQYAGDLELSHIGIWPDPTAVINLFSGFGNPYQGNFGFQMNQDNPILKVDQDFEIIIRRYSE